MADSYQVLSTRRTAWVRSATDVMDAEEISVITKPSGVTFVRVVPHTSFLNHQVGELVQPIADHIELLMATQPISSGVGVQEINSAGLITNSVEFTAYYIPPDPNNPGPFTTTVTIPVQTIHDLGSLGQFFVGPIESLVAAASL